MKYLFFLLLIAIATGCETARQTATTSYQQGFEPTDPLITQSLFNDKSSTISEENIQKILDGNYKLPPKLRVAII